MIPRALLFTGMLCCGAAACTTQPDDPQGTYHLAISLRPPDLLPGQQPLPSTISWPQATDLMLRFDAADHAQVELLGERGLVSMPKIAMASNSNQFVDPVEDGTLVLGVNSSFMIRVDDVVACPQTHTQDYAGSYFELFFLNGHVHGTTAAVASCLLAHDDPVEGFIFDVTGDRVSE